MLYDLLLLRKGPGYTAARLAKRTDLVACLGGAHEPSNVLRERLESAIYSLRVADADLLLDIFALTPRMEGVTQLGLRRDAVAQRLGITREAVADRDAAATTRLQTQLLTGWYPKSPTGLRITESHNGFLHHSVRITTVVRDRKHLETRHHYRLLALFDGIEYLAISAAGWDPPVALSPNFRLSTIETAGGQSHQFWHAAPMQRGYVYDLSFRVPNADQNDPYWLTEESLAFHEPTRFAEFEVMFIGQAPAAVWKVDGMTALERPGEPSKATFLPTGSSTVHARFRDAYGGLFYGIAWDW
ncbi:hypothetical protein [Nocardioides flavescens]|uniref:Uncharacterized protein n=1 Tax=Nocardioides flavescens TaxID=2691959 RepID=A0A6L7EP95_9ACTN|nr:hypothetical protein [Nocardioides flavescens]MXG88430.1 hypothetical protein [Nocardioides flavescens]